MWSDIPIGSMLLSAYGSDRMWSTVFACYIGSITCPVWMVQVQALLERGWWTFQKGNICLTLSVADLHRKISGQFSCIFQRCARFCWIVCQFLCASIAFLTALQWKRQNSYFKEQSENKIHIDLQKWYSQLKFYLKKCHDIFGLWNHTLAKSFRNGLTHESVVLFERGKITGARQSTPLSKTII